MKRTAERVLGIIGLVLFVIGGGLFAIVSVMQQSGALEDSFEEWIQAAEEQGQTMTDEEKEGFEIAAEYPYGTYALASFLAAVAGLVAVIIVSKKSVASGVLFLVMIVIYGLMVGLWMFLLSFLPILMYLIAGIISLVRRAPKDPVSLQE
ncbi:DUF4064 domain-containing protein [Shouchella lonarensis]|uniref:DUF4064 domain-containing protein n=1 Tax=Shouchella lonarensis TaxID=1464122 RepID=A0A1G6GVA5_9BACI|nr:DUF4064 domain-containing protein [Shouchella lonarensis]SDB85793.1 Protein of unknown function [Shouchella lonarensis]